MTAPASRLSGVLVFLLLLILAGGAWAAGTAVVERSDDDLLIVELKLGHRVLAEAVPAYLGSGVLLVPMGLVMDALELAVEVDPGSATAQGWFVSEDRRFFLDLGRREVVVEGRPAPFVDELIELHADDVYVDTTLLRRWFPVDFEVDLQGSRILVHPREKLPVELAAERRRRWRRSGEEARAPESYRFAREPLPYLWLDWPVVDQSLSLSFRQGAGGAPSTALPSTVLRSNLLAAGDVLRMNGELALGLDDDGDVTTRLRLGRRDPEAGLLGPLRATSFQLGDLYTPGRPLISREGEARGFEVSSFPLDRPREFDRTTLAGDALPGWEVELYHNESLIDFQAVGEESRYEFRAVPLYFGLNVLRLTFHGPQGQRREKVERILIGRDLISRGESYYRFAVYEGGHRVVPELDGGFPEPDGGFPEPDAAPRELGESGEPRFFFELERGLRRDLSMSWSVHSLPLADGRHTYAGAGLTATRKGVLVDAHLAADAAGGWAGRLAARGSLSRWDFRLRHERFFDFASEETSTRFPLSSRSALEVSSRLKDAGRWKAVLAAGAEEERYATGASASAVSLRLAARVGRLSLAKTLRSRRDPWNETGPRTVEGGWIVTARRASFQVRGGLGYSIAPALELRDVQLTAQWNVAKRFHARLFLRRGLSDDLTDSVHASLTRRFERFALSLDARWDERSRLGAGVTLSHSFGREPHSGAWRSSSRSLAAQGVTAARVFLDHDLDGRFGPGDEPLEGVKLTADGGVKGDPSNREGIVLVAGLAPHRHTDLALHLRSLEDPYWIPSREGVGLVTRPGRTARLELPVTVSAEIDGTVYLSREDGRKAVAGVELQLVDARGEVRYEATSAFDGFYLFDRVIPGRYVLRVDPGQVTELGLAAPPGREVVLGGEAVVMSGVDLVLDRRIPARRATQ